VEERERRWAAAGWTRALAVLPHTRKINSEEFTIKKV